MNTRGQIFGQRLEPVARIANRHQPRSAFFEFSGQRAELGQWTRGHRLAVDLRSARADRELEDATLLQAPTPADRTHIIENRQTLLMPFHAAAAE